MTATAAPILVTGATGRHGSTGWHVAHRLHQEGRAVRILTRSINERTDQLAALGAEVVIGDLHDRRTLLPARRRRPRLFHVSHRRGSRTRAANYAAAVREVGGEIRTVVMSMAPAHPAHPSDLGRDQWLAEEAMAWAGLDVLVLRIAATIHENIVTVHGDSIRRDDMLRTSFGDRPMGWINGTDAAEVAVAALLHPERFDGTICYPNGSEGLNHHDIAEILTQVLGRPITFQSVSRDEWRRELTDLSATHPGGVVNPAMAAHISSVGDAVAPRGAPSADYAALSSLIGRAPVSLRDYVRDQRLIFDANR